MRTYWIQFLLFFFCFSFLFLIVFLLFSLHYHTLITLLSEDSSATLTRFLLLPLIPVA